MNETSSHAAKYTKYSVFSRRSVPGSAIRPVLPGCVPASGSAKKCCQKLDRIPRRYTPAGRANLVGIESKCNILLRGIHIHD